MSQEEHAVVLGASLAGLLAARVAADSFRHVTVIERDRLPSAIEHRPGVPQGRHLHLTLASGTRILEELLPGITADLTADGALIFDPGLSRRFTHGNYLYREPTDLHSIGATRTLLESHVRRHVLSRQNIELRERCTATGLVADKDVRAIHGVRIRRRGEGLLEESLSADLIIDATGRGSRSAAWLRELGCDLPQDDVVHVNVGYATRMYRRTPADLEGDPLLVVLPSSPNRRAGAAMAVEGDRWIVILAGMLGELPPIDDDGFLAFASGLATPDLHEFISSLEPLGPAVRTRFPAHSRRRFERLRPMLERFVVVGDAACSFNPLYGQGISVAAKEALILRDRLRDDRLSDVPRRYFRAAAKAIAVPWSLGVGNDLQFPEVKRPHSIGMRSAGRYTAWLLEAAAHDPCVARTFSEVAHLVASPAALVHPRIVKRVLAARVRRSKRSESPIKRPAAQRAL